MWSRFSLVLGLGSLVLLTGCQDRSTPEGAAGVAFRALQKNNLPDLRQVLSDRALERFGHRQGMESLREQLGRLKLKLGEALPEEIREFPGYTLKSYEINVLGRPERSMDFARIMKLKVECIALRPSGVVYLAPKPDCSVSGIL